MTERTEGWPVGLYLAALIAGDSDGEALAISGDDRYVADYLYRESLARLPESDQRFLRRTAVLDQLCGPLCDALLGESGAQERLRRLEASSLFLIPLDRRREWYRYHAPVPGVPARRAAPGRARRRHQAAPAGRRLVRGQRIPGDGPRAPVEHRRAGPMRPAGDRRSSCPPTRPASMSTVQRWLAALGDAAIESYPRSPCWPAGSRCSPGRPPRRSGGPRSSTPPRSTWCRSTARRRSTRRGRCCEPCMCAAGPEQMLSDASFAVGAGAAVEPVARHGALLLRARRICSPATSTRPLRLFAEASDAGRRACRTPTRSSSARPSSRCWPWIAGGGRRRPSTRRGARRHRRAPDARLRHERARLRRRGPARACTGAT